jgi:glucokinase
MKRVVGIDIGGTKTAIGLVSGDGAVEGAVRLPTNPHDGFTACAARMLDAIHGLLDSAGCGADGFAGIGIGCPGPLDETTGVVLHDPTLLGWKGYSITAPFEEAFGVPTSLVNDADAALLGEAWVGAATGCTCAAMFTFGTGVGGAALVEGRLLRGVGGEHPELGHVPVDPTGPACYCGLRGCLESLASGPALANAAKGAGLDGTHRLFADARRGELAAVAVVRRAGEAIALATAAIAHALLPEVVVLGGGVMDEHFDLLSGPSVQMLAELSLASHRTPRLLKAALGPDGGMLGAARLAQMRIQGKTP